MTKEQRLCLQRFLRKHEIQSWRGYKVLYKATTRNYDSPLYPGAVQYRPYTQVTIPAMEKDPTVTCGEGIHVGTRECALSLLQSGEADRIMRVLVRLQHIAPVSDNATAALTKDAQRHKLRVKTLFVVDDIVRRKEGEIC